MLIAKVQNEQVIEVADYRDLFPNTSFAVTGPDAAFLAENSCMTVTVFKAYDADTEKLVNVSPYVEGNTVYTVAVEPLTEEEIAAIKAAKLKQFMDYIVSQTQNRLDSFAKTRNYDGILSLCTYATSSVQKFAQEGQYGVTSRDATWKKLYEIMDEVEAGTRPMPSSFADIESDLPILEWPI